MRRLRSGGVVVVFAVGLLVTWQLDRQFEAGRSPEVMALWIAAFLKVVVGSA